MGIIAVVANAFLTIILVITTYLYAPIFIGLEFYQQYLADGIYEDINLDFSVFTLLLLLIFVHFY